jgi:serine/threonine protein kinase
MTPEYASPEQIRGATVGTSSDVYSLGVLLYELVSGKRPFDLRGKTLDEVLTAVVHTPPEAPRNGAADLEAILLKALRKEPVERYESAEGRS